MIVKNKTKKIEYRRWKRKKGREGTQKSVLEALGSPWEVQKELPGATEGIDGTPTPPWSGGLGLATSLRLGGSEDLRLRSEATRGLTRRWDGELVKWVQAP